jgi:Ca-activated chloride channel homolog
MKSGQLFFNLFFSVSLIFLNSCTKASQNTGFPVKFEVGSALGKFCELAAEKINQKNPKLENGKSFFLTCEAKGSGDILEDVLSKVQQVKSGALKGDSDTIASIIALDGEIYQEQLIYKINSLFPGQNYIPATSDSELIAHSPIVFMSEEDLAKGLEKVPDLFSVLVNAKTHNDIDPGSPPLTIHYVQTAPTRSNSGLQTLIAQFASVSKKRPEDITLADVKNYQAQIAKIQKKVTRYGISTDSLAKAMVKNGPFWASIGSVYESSVIEVNSNLQSGQKRYVAIYPKATFSSNMRAFLPNFPWISADKKAAAEKILTYLKTDEIQQIAVSLGLRPANPGIALGPKFTSAYGVKSQPQYDSYHQPKVAVVDSMLKSWDMFAKKPSLVAIVIDVSGSMKGEKITAVQNSLKYYIEKLHPQDKLALISFSSKTNAPVLVDGTDSGRYRAMQFISNLEARGGTKLYDSILYARNWLEKNLRKEGINAIIVLTDGQDTESSINLEKLNSDLQTSGYKSERRISLFTIGYGGIKESDFDPNVLKKIADSSGGYYSSGDPSTIVKLMDNLQLEF